MCYVRVVAVVVSVVVVVVPDGGREGEGGGLRDVLRLIHFTSMLTSMLHLPLFPFTPNQMTDKTKSHVFHRQINIKKSIRHHRQWRIKRTKYINDTRSHMHQPSQESLKKVTHKLLLSLLQVKKLVLVISLQDCCVLILVLYNWYILFNIPTISYKVWHWIVNVWFDNVGLVGGVG